MEKLTVGSLFSGIGGIDLGLERTNGFTVKWQCEIDEYATRILAKHWPDVTRYGDIRECGSHNLAPVDCIVGGFPCQPHSLAGKRQASGDERDLWGEFYRVICELKPRWVMAENVCGLLSSENGRFFGRVLRDLATSGYDAEWQVLSAASVGAHHKRDRVFLVAYTQSIGRRARRAEWQSARKTVIDCTSEFVADATSKRLPIRGYSEFATSEAQARTGMEYQPQRRREDMADTDRQGLAVGQVFGRHAKLELAAFKRDCSTGTGIWAVESSVGRVANGVPRRVERLRGLGNAVVPQCAQFVGECILAAIAQESEAIA